MVGLGRFELPTSRLSGVRSNHLSYRPDVFSHKKGAETTPDCRYVLVENLLDAGCLGFHQLPWINDKIV